MYLISSTPFSPVSLFASTSAIVFSLSSLLPLNCIIGCSFSMEAFDNPSFSSSAFTASSPILSSLSMAVVIWTIFSCSPMTSAIPESILRLFIFICTRIPNLVKTVSIICINSTSLSRESEPTMSASH